MGLLDRKVALITGAGAGMGRSHSLLFASEGAHIYATDIDLALAQDTAAKVQGAGGSATALLHDVSSEDHWSNVLQSIDDAHGQLDILVNNAGIAIYAYLESVSDESWDRTFSINANGAFLGCKYAVELLKKSECGAIVNIASSLSHYSIPTVAPYCATKGTVFMLTKAAAFEYAQYGIRVNSVHPGIVRTPMTNEALADPQFVESVVNTVPLRRVAEPEEVSAVVLFLASERASFVTGTDVVVDSGAFASKG